MKITSVSSFLFDDKVRPFHWQVDRPGSGDGRHPEKNFSCVVAIETDEGIVGFSKAPKGRIMMDLVERRFGPDLLNRNPLNSEEIWQKCWDTDRLEEYPLYAISVIDVGIWDIKAKHARLPMDQVLGGYSESIPGYASTTSYDTLEEYRDVVDAALEANYPSIKLHLRQRDVRSNAKLCTKVREWVGEDYSLTLDASGLWNYTDSLWFGRVLEELKFEWYEEPMREFELEAYRKLCEALDIPILAAECSDGAHWNAAEFIRRNACDIMRTSTHYKGGFTGGIRVAHTAEAFGMNAEVHGGGHANLHLCLAIPNCTYYEDLVIDPIDIESRKRGPLVFKDGNFGFPEGLVGLGLEFDLEDLKKSCLSSITVK